MVVLLLLWSSSAMAVTLTWNANTEIDLVGYKVYQCGALPCAPGSGREALLVTLGKVTSYNIGTPSATKYYYITAYDTANLESSSSNLATYTPAGSPGGSTGGTTTTNPLANVTPSVLPAPAIAAWGVARSTTDRADVMPLITFDGKPYWWDNTPS